MDQFQYLILLGLCLLITLPLEFLLRARVYRRPLRLLLSVLPVLVIFTGWDLLGIVARHWTYNPRYVTGAGVGPIPVEELAFFVVVPICGLLTYGAVGQLLPDRRRHAGAATSGSGATARHRESGDA